MKKEKKEKKKEKEEKEKKEEEEGRRRNERMKGYISLGTKNSLGNWDLTRGWRV